MNKGGRDIIHTHPRKARPTLYPAELRTELAVRSAVLGAARLCRGVRELAACCRVEPGASVGSTKRCRKHSDRGAVALPIIILQAVAQTKTNALSRVTNERKRTRKIGRAHKISPTSHGPTSRGAIAPVTCTSLTARRTLGKRRISYSLESNRRKDKALNKQQETKSRKKQATRSLPENSQFFCRKVKSDIEQTKASTCSRRRHSVKCKGGMGLGADYCYKQVCLWLCSGHSHKVLDDVGSYRLLYF